MSERKSTKISRVCEVCSKAFLAVRAEVKRGKGFLCSNECRIEWSRCQLRRICECCGAAFFIKRSQIQRGRGVFCSRLCKYHGTTASPEERFWGFVGRKTATGCILWTGSPARKYGVLTIKDRTFYAHRVSFQLFRATIPATMDVLHACDTPLCINPQHLFLGTNADNKKDSVAKGRQAKGEMIGLAILSTEIIHDIRRRYFDGATQNDLACHYGITQGHVSAIIRCASWKHVNSGVPSGGRPCHGELHGQAKLTTGEVIEIRQRNGQTHDDIAKEFGVSRTVISQIKARKRWRHVP